MTAMSKGNLSFFLVMTRLKSENFGKDQAFERRFQQALVKEPTIKLGEAGVEFFTAVT